MAKRRKRGNGSLHLKKDGRWEGRCVVGHDGKGRPKTKNVLAKAEGECAVKLKALKESLKDLELERPRGEVTFGIWVDHWCQTYCKPTIKPRAQADYENRIYQHIIPELGHTPLSQLTQSDLQQFYHHPKQGGRLLRAEQYDPGLPDHMVGGCHVACRMALDRAVADGLILKNPAADYKAPVTHPREMSVLTGEEIQRLLIQAKEDGCYELLLLELSADLRRGEVLALQWDDLDFRTGALRVERQVQRIRGELMVSEPKTRTSSRSVILPAPFLKVLKQYRKVCTSRWIFSLPKKADSPLDLAAVWKKLATVLERTGYKRARFHGLRHTFTTNAPGHGISIEMLSVIIGYVSSATILNVYAHVTDEMRQRTVDHIDREIADVEPPSEPARKKEMTPTPFRAVKDKYHKPGTGCMTQIGDHLWKGHYFPKVDGKRIARNVYTSTEEECEQRLAELVREVKKEPEPLRAREKTY